MDRKYLTFPSSQCNGVESTLIGWGDEEVEFEVAEALRLALSNTLMTPSEVRDAGSSPLLVLMFLSAP